MPLCRATKEVVRARVFSIMQEELVFPDGREATYHVVRHPGAVVIVPRRADGKFLMVDQFRHPFSRYMLEFPAGTLESGEQPIECARRELVEEVGYAASRWQELGVVISAPGFCDEQLHVFVAHDLTPEWAKADDDELIEVREFSQEELEDMIRTGEISDGKTISAYFRAKLNGAFD